VVLHPDLGHELIQSALGRETGLKQMQLTSVRAPASTTPRDTMAGSIAAHPILVLVVFFCLVFYFFGRQAKGKQLQCF